MKLLDRDGVTIPFDNAWSSVAISVSGGADSALLAYLICDNIEQQRLDTQVHFISHTRMWKTRPWQAHDSLQVFQWFVRRFPTIIFKRHTNFIAPELEYGSNGPTIIDEYNKRVSGDNIQQRAFAEYLCHRENISAYYNAVTCNPRDVDIPGGVVSRDIERTDTNGYLELMEHMGRYACHPFRFVEKSWVVKQYQDCRLMDLFDITRSCEGEFAEINYATYTPGQHVPVCNECFWCKEREWAIEQNK